MAQTYEKPSITTELAHRMIAAAEQKAQEMGHPFVIAVVDESGVLKAFSRMDNAALLSVQVAQDKADTAVGFGMPTDRIHAPDEYLRYEHLGIGTRAAMEILRSLGDIRPSAPR